jgi:transposase
MAFPVEFRLRIVKLYLKEGYSPKLLVAQFGISTKPIQCWVRGFRLHGTVGLEPKRRFSRKSRVVEVCTRVIKPVITPTAWLVAAKQWLLKNRLIRIQMAGNVSPNFIRKWIIFIIALTGPRIHVGRTLKRRSAWRPKCRRPAL